jgi:hypothetical protein
MKDIHDLVQILILLSYGGFGHHVQTSTPSRKLQRPQQRLRKSLERLRSRPNLLPLLLVAPSKSRLEQVAVNIGDSHPCGQKLDVFEVSRGELVGAGVDFVQSLPGLLEARSRLHVLWRGSSCVFEFH